MKKLPSAKDLIYFQGIAKELHFSHAAKKLNVTQPSLTMAVKRLEDLLNTTLFIRHTQGVTLSRSGKKLLVHVEKLLLSWESIVSDITDISRCEKGKVTIGCHSTIAPFMSNMVAKLLANYPGMEINFQHESTIKIMENVLQGKIDIGLVTDPRHHPDIILQLLTYTEFAFWVSIQHEENLDLYAKNTVIICDPALPPTQYLLKKLANKVKHVLRLSTMNQIESMAAMAAEGCGIGILPSAFTQTFFGHKLKTISKAPIYKKQLYLCFRSENKNFKVIQLVLKKIKKLIN
jgi:LysR family transcriptional regulator, salicylic acid-responsive activator of bsdBCD